MLDKIPQPIRGLTSYVTFHLMRAQNKLNAQATSLLKSLSDLSLVEWRIIQLLRLHDGATMSELAEEVAMDKGQLSRKVSTLVEKGLITTRQDETDHRKQQIRLTDKALALSDDLMPVMQRRQDMLVKGVSAADLETFFKVLAIINERAENRKVP